MKNKVLIVDDHPVTRAGVRAILEADKSIEIIGEAIDGKEAVDIAREKNPDIVVMDISMPQLSGIDATREILNHQPDIKVIALSIHSAEKFVQEMLDAGAEGYLLKEDTSDELIIAIKKINRGEMYLSSGVTKTALRKNDVMRIDSLVIQSKLYRPRVMPDYIVRSEIIQELERNAGRPFSLVSAGAGYGKSICVSQWLDQTEYFNSWISLDQDHNDMRLFLKYLVSAVEKVFPGILKDTLNLALATTLPPVKEISNILINDLCNIDLDLILVLDDYHTISNNQIHELINEWLKFPPPNLHLCIVTRRDPPLNLNSLKMAGRMTEIRMDALGFTLDEIRDFYQQMLDFNLEEKSIELIESKTEGWIIALRLASMIIKDQEDVERVFSTMEKGLSIVSDYLISEVLSKQPVEIQKSLLISSLFNRFNEDLLDDLQMEGIENSGRELIKWIIKSNLFVFELDRLGEWFRYHHLFQSLLRTQLKNQVTNKELIQYHSKASLWFEQKGFLEESLDHALAANDISRASDIVKNHRMDLISSDNYFALERLQRKIPESIIENDPELLVVEEYLAWNNYEMMKIVEISDKWASQFEKKYKNSILAAENGFFNGFKYLFQGDSGSHIEGIKKSLKIIPESAHGARQIVELHFLMYSQSVGEYDSSKEWFSKSLKRIDEYPYSRKNLLYVGILIANLDEADLVEMEKNYLDAIKTGRESKLNNRGNIIMLAANLMMRQGRWEESIEYFREGLDLKYVFFTRSVVDIMTGHIVVNALMGKYEKCHDLMRDFKKYVDNTGEYLTTYLWSCQIRYQLIRGNKQAIRELLPAYQSVVFDVIIWMDFPDITYANALVFEGSEKNLKTAKSELERLAQLFSAEQNWIHLLEVHAVQALCFEKQGDTEKAKEALSKSIDLAEEGSVTGFYIELGNDLLQLVNKMPEDFKNKRFITKIMDGIKQLEILRRNLPPEPEESKITDKKKGDLITLTQKEMDVLRLVADGFRNKEIADKLFNSEETIKKHIYNIFQKLHVKNRLSLVSKAREEGILTE